jgi:hypothetical protein
MNPQSWGGPAAAALAALALATGCDRLVAPRQRPIYAAWEEGLTLGYEDPSLDPALRFQNRQQVRVKEAKPVAGGWEVTRTYSSYTNQADLRFLLRDGGVLLRVAGGEGIPVLPEGFPDRVCRWQSRGAYSFVVGRAMVDLPGVRLPDERSAVGVWVETVPVDRPGQRIRTLFLPDVGEAEALVWRGGRWVANNVLVSRGFTDLPMPPTPPPPLIRSGAAGKPSRSQK